MEILGPFWDQLITTGLLASLTGFLLRVYITTSLKKLDEIPEKLTVIREELSGINVHLEKLDTIEHIVHEHSKVIAVLEALSDAKCRDSRNGKKTND